MQCILYKIYFWKVFHMNYNLICIFICTPICTNFFILVKSGHYSLVHERTTLSLYALFTAHVLIMVIVSRVGLVFLQEGFTPILS
jgi:hypothetical protein